MYAHDYSAGTSNPRKVVLLFWQPTKSGSFFKQPTKNGKKKEATHEKWTPSQQDRERGSIWERGEKMKNYN